MGAVRTTGRPARPMPSVGNGGKRRPAEADHRHSVNPLIWTTESVDEWRQSARSGRWLMQAGMAELGPEADGRVLTEPAKSTLPVAHRWLGAGSTSLCTGVEPRRDCRRLQLLKVEPPMSKTTNKFSPEVRSRAVRLVLDHEKDHPSRWASVSSVATKIGCSAHTLTEWVKKAEVDKGSRAGIPADVQETLKAQERAHRDAGLKADIRRVFDENFQVYGVRKVWRPLQREGRKVARCTVGRLMRGMSLRGAIRGKSVKTTIQDKGLPCPLDHVNRHVPYRKAGHAVVVGFHVRPHLERFCLCGLHHRRLRSQDRWLAGFLGGRCRFCPGCSGTGPASAPAGRQIRAGSPLGQGQSICVHQAHRASAPGWHRILRRQRRRFL